MGQYVLDMAYIYTPYFFDLPIIKVEICIKNALALYGHCEDHVRPAQPMTSAIDHALSLALLIFYYP